MVKLGGHGRGMETGDTCNPCVQAGNHHTILQITIVDHGEKTWVVARKSVGIVHLAISTPVM